MSEIPEDIIRSAHDCARRIYLNVYDGGTPYMTSDDILEVAKAIHEEREKHTQFPHDVIATLLAIGPVEWGRSFEQPDEKHVSDFVDTLRITREHFGTQGETAIHGVYLAGTNTVLAHTGSSPNSPQHARILVGAWNRMVEIARLMGDERKGE